MCLVKSQCYLLIFFSLLQDDSTSAVEATGDMTTKSRALTQNLLNLDLGYSVLNEELMRRSMGVDVERLDVLPEDDGNDADGEEFFESLPQPQSLGRHADPLPLTERFIAIRHL